MDYLFNRSKSKKIKKRKDKTYEKIINITKTIDYTTGNLLVYEYYSKHKLIAIDLSKQIQLEKDNKLILLASLKMTKQQCFSFLRNQKKQLLNFHKTCFKKVVCHRRSKNKRSIQARPYY